MEQFVKGGGVGFAGEMLRQKLDTLGAELNQAERQLQSAASRSASRAPLEDIPSRLASAFADLRSALYGEEREAARARELLRATINRITIAPIYDGRNDGRGAGPVRVQVEGQLADLLGLADLTVGHMVLTNSSALTGQNLASFHFKLWLELSCSDKALEKPLSQIEDMLIRARAPVRLPDLLEAVKSGAVHLPGAPGYPAMRSRIYTAMDLLVEEGVARRLRKGQRWGWVHAQRRVSDEEWWRRAQGEIDTPLPPIVTWPSANVVVVGGV
jgi:hypothetical protein